MEKSSLSPRPPAATGEGSGKTAPEKWVGWEEEEIKLNGCCVVCYYLLRAPSRSSHGAEVPKEPAVVGKFWGEGNMQYSAHPQFLRSIQAAVDRSPGPSRAMTVAVEATQELRWKSRREVMDWLTSLVADSPYISSASADTSDGRSLDDHDGGSTSSKDDPTAFAGNNPEGFAWLGPMPHLDKWRKHYRSFCRDGMRISVHDFIYIKSEEGTQNNLAYVEDMYELDGGANNMVLARLLKKPGDDHGVVMPSDVHEREVFFSDGLQDIEVNWVEGLAPVLNYEHFESFQRREEEHSKWKPYLCHRQILGKTLKPFNIAKLGGYAKQEIVRALLRAPSYMSVHSKEPNKDKTNGGQKRKLAEIIEDPAAPGNVTCDRAVETHTALVAIDTLQKLPQCNATNDQTVAKDAPENVAINDQTAQKLPPCNATNHQTVQKLLPPNVISHQTGKNNVPVNAPKTETVKNGPPHNAAHSQAVEKLHPSGGSASGSGLVGNVIKPNKDELLNVGSRIEILSQDSGLRGCWFRCVIVKKKQKGDQDLIKVKYQDVPNFQGTGRLREWIRVKRTAEPDRLGVRLTGRSMIRPWFNLPNTPSPVASGAIVDVWLQKGWWEGIVVEPRTVGLVRVYLPGERKIGEFVEGDLRRSHEWVGDRWLRFMERKDVAARLPPSDVPVQVIQVRPKPEMQKGASVLSSMGGPSHVKPAGPSILQRIKGDQSAEPMLPVAILESSQVDEISSKPAAHNTSSQKSSLKAKVASAELAAPRPMLQSREKVEDEPAKPLPQKTSNTEKPRLQPSKKGPDDEPAKPAAEKVRVQSCQEGGGTSFADGVPADAKRPRVELTNFLKSENVLKWAERKARGSGPLMGYSDCRSQDGVADSTPNGHTALLSSVPDKEECKTNEVAPVSTPQLLIELSDDE